jgi:predicted nucleic acid-binding protein
MKANNAWIAAAALAHRIPVDRQDDDFDDLPDL